MSRREWETPVVAEGTDELILGLAKDLVENGKYPKGDEKEKAVK